MFAEDTVLVLAVDHDNLDQSALYRMQCDDHTLTRLKYTVSDYTVPLTARLQAQLQIGFETTEDVGKCLL